MSPEWKSKVGTNTSVEWPVGIGAKGNEGVANNVGQDQGLDRLRRIRLCQAEQADHDQDGQQGRQDSCADARRRSGRCRQCRLEVAAPGFWRDPRQLSPAPVLADAGATFILVHKQPPDPAATGEALKFFAWAYKNGDKMAEGLDYVPMPDSVVKTIEDKWKVEIKDSERQAGLLIADPMGKGARPGAFSLSTALKGGLSRGLRAA